MRFWKRDSAYYTYSKTLKGLGICGCSKHRDGLATTGVLYSPVLRLQLRCQNRASSCTRSTTLSRMSIKQQFWHFCASDFSRKLDVPTKFHYDFRIQHIKLLRKSPIRFKKQNTVALCYRQCLFQLRKFASEFCQYLMKGTSELESEHTSR